ncbi:hypothetical protein GUITHDRAFT_154419 [Guillardia theta CCMP2712]|uniref:Protein-export membrane protein SecG n=2 Tax=Guillardia theta TaxID=55529 RepID=L1ITM9_GUITC|nr:hypothetical protein GUITHDRAFT_154419 [Guillardia theta CCMP2712]EKX39457.1 hypothetical protein GUITHDRAFT_154419 [Guillardia theta CCMP2712]|eukprot:XP_005826437.1 hypothetical protein GUITHDRAFT_154419 [Guillardia theta CCMP2712]
MNVNLQLLLSIVVFTVLTFLIGIAGLLQKMASGKDVGASTSNTGVLQFASQA